MFKNHWTRRVYYNHWAALRDYLKFLKIDPWKMKGVVSGKWTQLSQVYGECQMRSSPGPDAGVAKAKPYTPLHGDSGVRLLSGLSRQKAQEAGSNIFCNKPKHTHTQIAALNLS